MGNLRPDGTKQAAAESDPVTGGERESLNNNSFSQPNAGRRSNGATCF